MNAIQLAPNLYAISLGGVNAFLIDGDELILIDTGIPNSSEHILGVIQELKRKPEELRHILVTHSHPDHAGSLGEMKRRTGATAYMHPLGAEITRIGKLGEQSLKPTPGMEEMFEKFIGFGGGAEYEGAAIENEIKDGEVLPLAGGIRVIHVPGHSAGQVAFLWGEYGGVLFAADAASNMMGLNFHLGYEDFEEGKRSLGRLSKLEFEIACFGHGEAILQGASSAFKQKWGKD